MTRAVSAKDATVSSADPIRPISEDDVCSGMCCPAAAAGPTPAPLFILADENNGNESCR